MTHDQLAREAQEADRIRAMIAERSGKNISNAMKAMQDGPTSGWYGKAMEAVKDFANWGNEIGEMMKDSPAAQAYDSARVIMADVNRRVFEEPWFGKPVADILMDRQQNPLGRDRNVDQDYVRTEQEKGEEQATIHGKNEPQQEQESAWDKMYGSMQVAEQEHGQEQDAGK